MEVHHEWCTVKDMPIPPFLIVRTVISGYDKLSVTEVGLTAETGLSIKTIYCGIDKSFSLYLLNFNIIITKSDLVENQNY